MTTATIFPITVISWMISVLWKISTVCLQRHTVIISKLSWILSLTIPLMSMHGLSKAAVPKTTLIVITTSGKTRRMEKSRTTGVPASAVPHGSRVETAGTTCICSPRSSRTSIGTIPRCGMSSCVYSHSGAIAVWTVSASMSRTVWPKTCVSRCATVSTRH